MESGTQRVRRILDRKDPGGIVYAPNFWQWFAHHKNHGTLPAEVAHCDSQLALIRHLGLDVFSRNVYCDQSRRWFGGLAEETFDGVEERSEEHFDGRDLVMTRRYSTSRGELWERKRYVGAESTLVQEKFLVDDYASQLDAFEELTRARRWRFAPDRHARAQNEVGDDGVIVAGELHSPLKMMHFAMGPIETVYCITDYPERARAIMRLHEQAQLDLINVMAKAGVSAMMSQDNLDTMFHPPEYVKSYCASYYEQASALCHERGSAFFIHACGQQRENLALISSLGVDGLEGVAYPPLGDVQLEEAMRLTGDRFIITGGISAMEFQSFHSKEDVFGYTRNLLERMRPFANRFMFSASCNTPINAGWDAIRWFRDAWLDFGGPV
jgi:uroporphyrinogen-III decarboxylase